MGEANVWQPRTIVEITGDSRQVEQNFLATKDQQLFVLTDFAYKTEVGALEVYVGGLRQTKFKDWVEVSSNSFMLTVPISEAGTKVSAVGNLAITSAIVSPLDMLGDGIWVAGKTFTGYNQYLVYAGVTYIPKTTTLLPYTVEAAPDLNKVAIIDFSTADLVEWQGGKSVGYALDDYRGVKDELYSQAEITDDGSQNQLGNSQFVDALRLLFNNRGSVSKLSNGIYPLGSYVSFDERSNALFKLSNAGVPDGKGVLEATDGNVATYQEFKSTDIRHLGFVEGVTSDATDIINYAFANAIAELDLLGMDVVCDGDLIIPPTSKLRKLSLNGGKLTVKSGVFNIQVNHTFIIDLGGGEIDLGLKKAQLASDAPNGNVFNVMDASDFSVGDVVTCSFALSTLPNTTSRSSLPGNVLNTVKSIVGNVVEVTYPFVVDHPAYSVIPAGAMIINSIFSKAGIFYTGSRTFAIINGKAGRTSSGTCVAVNNVNATFWSQNVDYDEAGLDMFNLRCKNIIFDGFNIGTSYDIAKQGVVPEWSGLFSMSKGKFKRNCFDGEFYLPYNSELGDMYLSEVTGDGLYEGGITTGSFAGNAIFVGKFVAQNLKLRSLKLDRCRFINYQRNGFGSGDDVVTTARINSVEINNSECNVPWLRTTFVDANTLVSSDLVKIYGGSMGCSTSYRQNAGFSNVVYDNVDLRATAAVRYLNCQITNCRFNGGAHRIDSPSIVLGTNTLANGGVVLMQTGQIPTSAKLIAEGFKAENATGTFFPITNYVDSSLGQYFPNIELVVPDFVPKVKFGNANASVKYTIELSRISETTAPFDAKSRHAVYIVAGSLVHGVTDNTLYKSTVTATSVMSVDYPSGTTDLVQNNSGTLPAIGDIFAVLYANYIVGYHRITAAASNSFTISPALRENITTATLCGLNKITKLY